MNTISNLIDVYRILLLHLIFFLSIDDLTLPLHPTVFHLLVNKCKKSNQFSKTDNTFNILGELLVQVVRKAYHYQNGYIHISVRLKFFYFTIIFLLQSTIVEAVSEQKSQLTTFKYCTSLVHKLLSLAAAFVCIEGVCRFLLKKDYLLILKRILLKFHIHHMKRVTEMSYPSFNHFQNYPGYLVKNGYKY